MATPGKRLMMTAPATQITRPAKIARMLPMDVPFGKPCLLAMRVDSGRKTTHRSGLVTDEAMAGSKISVGGDAKISGACPARIGPMGAAMNFTERCG